MNKILKTLVVGVAGMSLATASMAQVAGPQGGTPPTKQQGHANMRQLQMQIMNKLDLTKDQKAKLKAERATMKEKVKALRAEADKNPTDKAGIKTKMMALRKEQHDAMTAILTQDQQAKFKTMWEDAVKKFKAEHKGKKPGKKGENKGSGGSTPGSGNGG
jgi:Spy/CpxP family protein refolding chaperone